MKLCRCECVVVVLSCGVIYVWGIGVVEWCSCEVV